MAKTKVTRCEPKSSKKAESELQAHLDALTSDGWSIVSVAPETLKTKGAGFTTQRVTTYLVVSKK